MSDAPRRTGARRIADIPPDVLAALNAGEIETRTLVEWLAIDPRALLAHAAADAGLATGDRERLDRAAAALAEEGVQRRSRGLGEAVFAVVGSGGRRFERLARHRSDMVRSWAAYAVGADPDLAFGDRLARLERFAADPSMSVRECAWDAWRPWFAQDVRRHVRALEPWTSHPDEGVRRCAVEGTRPRGVWTAWVRPLVERPEIGLPLLEPVRADASRYVQNAVANWLNDASKSRPEWVVEVTDRWLAESPGPETAYVVRRARRTLRKADGKESA